VCKKLLLLMLESNRRSANIEIRHNVGLNEVQVKANVDACGQRAMEGGQF